MADTLTDALRVERDLRAFIACRLGHSGPRAHERVARTADLWRIGSGVADIEALEVHIAEAWGAELIIGVNDTPATVADAIAAAIARKEAAALKESAHV